MESRRHSQCKTKILQDWTDKRNRIAQLYNDKLQNITGQVANVRDNAVSAFHLYVIHTENRDELMHYLNKHEVGAGLHYPIPIHLQVAYTHLDYKKETSQLRRKYISVFEFTHT